MSRASSAFDTSDTSAISASMGCAVGQFTADCFEADHRRRPVAARESHSINAARSPGIGQATPILIEFEDAIANLYSKAIATENQATFRGERHGSGRNGLRFCARE
jgi:hypothetical protein